MMTGFWIGLVAAFLAATFGTLNKKMVTQADPYQITFLELGSSWLFLSLFIPFVLKSNPEMAFWPSSLCPSR